MTATKSWNPLTQKYEEIKYNSGPLLTAEQYVSQLRIGSNEWFRNSDDTSRRGILVDNSIKWTLIYKDTEFIKLQRNTEITKISCKEFIETFSWDHKA